ncbi:family 78 glycoside hydrolase catalytic domain [Maribellus mangrovi]|uniref:family 78 glycoside hydrolase catalytic domain n=1 Tax=Maribellus mangrovi TaxID=3133146 RepID=UPI0030ECA999
MKMNRMLIFFASMIFLLQFSACKKSGELSILSSSVNHMENATGVASDSFFFSWKLTSSEKNVLQTAYQVQVSEQSDFSAPAWDSGKTESDKSILVNYTGPKLNNGQTYFWRVKTWDNYNNQSNWSEIRSFTTGLFTEQDWSGAKWIAYDELPEEKRIVPGIHLPGKSWSGKDQGLHKLPLLRKEFEVKEGLKQALVFVSGLGHYEMRLNGDKLGDRFISPGWTNYDETILYNTYDCTEQLHSGKNAVGMMLGNGFFIVPNERYRKTMTAYGNPMMIMKLKLVYQDGSEEDIISDKRWKTAPGPITFSSIFGGENYDARLEQAGWDEAGFDESSWHDVMEVEPTTDVLRPETDYPVKLTQELQPQKITKIEGAENAFLYDFGQNASGIFEISVEGNAGDSIVLIPSELISEDNTANQRATGRPHYYTYVLKGDGEETWRPRFTYYGFRYIQVDGGIPAKDNSSSDRPKIVSLKMLHNRNASPETGSFHTSFELFNQIDTLIKWAIQSNFQSVLTDCPHREKLGWLEQSFLMGGSVHYNFDIYNAYCKIVDDMIEAQTAEGLVPTIAPEYVLFDFANGDFRDSPEWGSAAVILPWLIYKWYGDLEPMIKAWPMMERYVAYLESRSENHIVDHGLGDWYDLGPERPGFPQLTPRSLTATAIYFYDVKLMTKMAALIGKQEKVNELADWASEIKTAFNANFFNPETKVYSTGSQTAIAMPLVVGLVEAENHEAVVQTLVESIHNSDNALTAGDIGFNYLVKALQNNGQGELLFEMNARNDVPGYGYQLKKGATALTESWPALEVVSNNHLMLGHIMEWFYNGLGGIGQTEKSVAYKQVIIEPQVVGGIKNTDTSFETPYGTVVSSWKDDKETFRLEVSIPVNSDAIIILPAKNREEILQDGEKLQEADIEYQNNSATIKVGSGSYSIEVKK